MTLENQSRVVWAEAVLRVGQVGTGLHGASMAYMEPRRANTESIGLHELEVKCGLHISY